MLFYKFINNEILFKQYYNKINLKSNNQMSSSRNNKFSKLLSCDIGDIIIIHQSKYKFTAIDFEVIGIENPENEYYSKSDDVVIRVVEKNFNIVKDSDILTVKHKNRPGKITLKRC